MTSVQRELYGVLCAVLVLAIAGCGGAEELVTVTGKVLDGGQPIAFEEDNQEAMEEMGVAPLEVELWPVDEGGNIDTERKPHGASVELDGSFRVAGPEGDGFPAGKYRVALRYMVGAGMATEAEEEALGPWGDKFTPKNSPWTYDFTGNQEITLDVAAAGQASASEPESPEPEGKEEPQEDLTN